MDLRAERWWANEKPLRAQTFIAAELGFSNLWE